MGFFIAIVFIIWFFWNTEKNWDGTRTLLDKQYKQERFFVILVASLLMFIIYCVWWVIDAGLTNANITWGGLITFLIFSAYIYAVFFQSKKD